MKNKNLVKKQRVKVLVTGVFDVLHHEHINFLKKARELGDDLVIGIESDVRVRHIKGEGRPINNQKKRAKALENLGLASEVVILPEKFSKPEDHLAFIKSVEPDILAVSSHTAHLDKKKKIMDLVGGKLEIVYEHNPNVSTTHLLQSKVPRSLE